MKICFAILNLISVVFSDDRVALQFRHYFDTNLKYKEKVSLLVRFLSFRIPSLKWEQRMMKIEQY